MNLYERVKMLECKSLLDEKDNSFMGYCPECGRETTFERSEWYRKTRQKVEIYRFNYVHGTAGKESISDLEDSISAMFNFCGDVAGKSSLYIQEYECCVNHSHRRYNIYYKNGKEIIKIGQYPSEVDDGSNEYLDKVRKICSKAEAKDIAKYIKTSFVMESYGYGIASLLYIRRAFEKLIAISEGKNEIDNTGITMKERIANNIYLPEQIKRDVRIYNVISEGIHNQTEEECMELFKIIKVGVIILITRTYAHVEEEKQLAELSRTISGL